MGGSAGRLWRRRADGGRPSGGRSLRRRAADGIQPPDGAAPGRSQPLDGYGCGSQRRGWAAVLHVRAPRGGRERGHGLLRLSGGPAPGGPGRAAARGLVSERGGEPHAVGRVHKGGAAGWYAVRRCPVQDSRRCCGRLRARRGVRVPRALPGRPAPWLRGAAGGRHCREPGRPGKLSDGSERPGPAGGHCGRPG